MNYHFKLCAFADEADARIAGQILSLEPHLSVFKGLDALEHGHKSEVGTYTFSDNKTAFDAAVMALRGML